MWIIKLMELRLSFNVLQEILLHWIAICKDQMEEWIMHKDN